MKQRILSLLLVFTLAVTLLPFGTVAADTLPDFFSETSAENALAILKAYDPDGDYLVNYVNDPHGVSFYLGSNSNAEGLETVVHEFYHAYSYDKPTAWRTEAIYAGDQTDILVSMDTGDLWVPTTAVWAETLPETLRTFRFDEYVSEGSIVSANQKGPYGLLNEFTAYCWGMHNQLALFPYYKAQENCFEVWSAFVSACGNDRQAYAEFRFWILGYLNAMKTDRPEVYEHFLSNQGFLRGYLTIKARFEAQIQEFERRCDEIKDLGAADGINVSFDGDYFWFGRYGAGTNYREYSLLLTELEKEPYQKMDAAILAACTEAPIPQPTEPTTAPTEPTTAPTEPTEADKPCDGGKGCPSYTFKDVKYGDWYHEAVDFAVAKGLFNGMSPTTFEPNTGMSRAMLVTVLWRYEDSPKGGVTAFTDVPYGQWYTDAVAWAAKNGIVDGVGNNKFAPNGTITREQMAAILYRYADWKGYDTSNSVSILNYRDPAYVSVWAKDAMAWTVAEGIITGIDYALVPQGNATRAQVATILMRFIENIAKK